MNRATPKMRVFAERLMAYEAKGKRTSEADSPTVFLVSEKLRPHLATLMGNAGFRGLLSRSLALANAEVAWLRAVHVKANGSLEGLGELAAEITPGDLAEGSVVLIAQLLGLLVTFIGEDLTARLVGEAWPKLSLNDLEFGKGGKNEKEK